MLGDDPDRNLDGSPRAPSAGQPPPPVPPVAGWQQPTVPPYGPGPPQPHYGAQPPAYPGQPQPYGQQQPPPGYPYPQQPFQGRLPPEAIDWPEEVKGLNIFGIGLISLVACGYVLGAVAIWMGVVGLTHINAGKADPAQKKLTIAGIVLGSIGLLLAVLQIPERIMWYQIHRDLSNDMLRWMSQQHNGSPSTWTPNRNGS